MRSSLPAHVGRKRKSHQSAIDSAFHTFMVPSELMEAMILRWGWHAIPMTSPSCSCDRRATTRQRNEETERDVTCKKAR